MTSRFWRQLADEQKSQLQTHGLEYVKRVQALRYFTWRWTPSRAIGGEQGRYLLRHTPFRSWVRAILTPADLADAAWAPTRWPRLDRWLYVLAARLLWEVAAANGSKAVLDLPEPTLGSPFSVRWRGRLISQDLANTALEMASIEAALAGHAPRHVLEIGAGYGRTAYAILSRYPNAAYTIVDINPALEIARWYLTTLFPGRELHFLEAHSLPATVHPFDLAVSISTLQEMSHDEVARYLQIIDGIAMPAAVVYLKQWERWWNPIDEIQQTTDQYVLPIRWRVLFSRRCQVQTRFRETAWVAGD